MCVDVRVDVRVYRRMGVASGGVCVTAEETYHYCICPGHSLTSRLG